MYEKLNQVMESANDIFHGWRTPLKMMSIPEIEGLPQNKEAGRVVATQLAQLIQTSLRAISALGFEYEELIGTKQQEQPDSSVKTLT